MKLRPHSGESQPAQHAMAVPQFRVCALGGKQTEVVDVAALGEVRASSLRS